MHSQFFRRAGGCLAVWALLLVRPGEARGIHAVTRQTAMMGVGGNGAVGGAGNVPLSMPAQAAAVLVRQLETPLAGTPNAENRIPANAGAAPVTANSPRTRPAPAAPREEPGPGQALVGRPVKKSDRGAGAVSAGGATVAVLPRRATNAAALRLR